MRTTKILLSIFLLIPLSLQCMEQQGHTCPSVSPLPQEISDNELQGLKIDQENTREFLIYRAQLPNGKQLIAKIDEKGHKECCRSSFPYEDEILGLEEVELPTRYFDVLARLYKQQQDRLDLNK